MDNTLCYLCGKEFAVIKALSTHESQCNVHKAGLDDLYLKHHRLDKHHRHRKRRKHSHPDTPPSIPSHVPSSECAPSPDCISSPKCAQSPDRTPSPNRSPSPDFQQLVPDVGDDQEVCLSVKYRGLSYSLPLHSLDLRTMLRLAPQAYISTPPLTQHRSHRFQPTQNEPSVYLHGIKTTCLVTLSQQVSIKPFLHLIPPLLPHQLQVLLMLVIHLFLQVASKLSPIALASFMYIPHDQHLILMRIALSSHMLMLQHLSRIFPMLQVGSVIFIQSSTSHTITFFQHSAVRWLAYSCAGSILARLCNPSLSYSVSGP